MSNVLSWAHTQPYLLPTALALALLLALAAAWSAIRAIRTATRPPAAVLVASLAAAACTAYSADTSWGFAADHLGMTTATERSAMFFAAELALFSVALMARQNLKTTGMPGTPGMLVWVITGVQIIPAFAESGFVGGLVRAFVGPVLAALLWHLAMGIELRHGEPGAGSQSLPALVARELRERLLSRLGLAVRDRTAEQITRDRWTVRAVDHAARLAVLKPGDRSYQRRDRKLSKAVGRAQVGANPEQRDALLQLLAARLHSSALATLALPSPWEVAAPQVVAPAVEAVVEDVPEVVIERVVAQPIPAAPAVTYPVLAEPALPTPAPPVAVLAAEAPRTRTQVRAEYVPDPAPAPVPATDTDAPGDELTTAARTYYRELLANGRTPSIRTLRDMYSVGQQRATRIQTELRKGLPS